MRQTGCPLPQPQRCLVEERAGAGVFNQNETAMAGKLNTARFGWGWPMARRMELAFGAMRPSADGSLQTVKLD